jgi:endonuclease YncB( thermonuclease family)
MRKAVPAVAALVILGAAATYAVATRHPAPPPAPATAVAAIAAIPPAAPSAPAAAPPAPAAPAPPKEPDLPTVEVAPRVVHVVPEDQPAPEGGPITLETREGRVIARTHDTAPPPAPVPSPVPRASPTHPLVGPATIAGGASLGLDGRTVKLFGVSAPGARDRCVGADGAAGACSDIARAALALRLKPDATVSCTMPPGQGRDPGFVCHDSTGVDLGGLLVAEGFALADTKSSYQYFGAEGVARSFHRGLWHYR